MKKKPMYELQVFVTLVYVKRKYIRYRVTLLSSPSRRVELKALLIIPTNCSKKVWYFDRLWTDACFLPPHRSFGANSWHGKLNSFPSLNRFFQGTAWNHYKPNGAFTARSLVSVVNGGFFAHKWVLFPYIVNYVGEFQHARNSCLWLPLQGWYGSAHALGT